MSRPQVVEDFGLVRFLPLAIEDRDSVARVLADVDRANGCAFSGLAAAAAPLPPELTYGAGLRGALRGRSISWGRRTTLEVWGSMVTTRARALRAVCCRAVHWSVVLTLSVEWQG